MKFEHDYDGNNPTFTGLDLSSGGGTATDKTVFFTFELQPDGAKRILDIESGRWSGPEIIDRIIDKTTRYKSKCCVETNATQDFIRQFALDKKKDLLIYAYNTTRANKLNVESGVESVFTEIRNKAWIIPCDDNGRVNAETQLWIDDMVFYQPPPAHTGDYLMACFLAREKARSSHRKDPRSCAGRLREIFQQSGY